MSLLERGDNAYLLLADGTIFEGLHFGVKGTAIGEVVFTTGMTAYQETLTDPSYYGQLVTQTFPLIGNYGVNAADSESARSYIHGYIVREWCNTPSNFRMEGDIDGFLKEQNIVGIYNIDTRKLTRIIREVGVMNNRRCLRQERRAAGTGSELHHSECNSQRDRRRAENLS